MDHSDHSSIKEMVSSDHAMHNMGDNAMGHDGHDGMEMDGMKMYFHVGLKETILFYGWKTDAIGNMIGSMIAIFFIALIYEGIKYYREYLFKKSLAGRYSSACSKNPANQEDPPVQMTILSCQHILQCLLHMIQFVISYSLMLIFMTYNIWLCLACVLGSGTGYFLFGWRKSVVVDVTEHCH